MLSISGAHELKMDAGVQVEPCDLVPLLETNGQHSSSSPPSSPEPLRARKTSQYYPTRRRKQPRCRVMIASLLFGVFFLVLVLVLYCPGDLFPTYSQFMPSRKSTNSSDVSDIPTFPTLPTTIPVNFVTFDHMQEENFEFNLSGKDVMVFLHIQKTGGTTFGKHLVQDIDLEEPCECRRLKKRPKSRQYKGKSRVKRKIKCECFRPGEEGKYWLFSRYSTGWKCGLHPDWTELTACVDHYLDATEGHADDRRYFYVTFLRDPVRRYLSEFRHVQRGATWKTALLRCNGRSPTPEEMPKCYQGEDWMDVTLPEFMGCPSNLAVNRQTRMLADLRLVNCYNTTGMSQSERDAIILQSAKENLHKMSFFGLTEMQRESQYVFQETFNLEFKENFVQYETNTGKRTENKLGDDVVARIKELNHLDIQLYDYAKQLMDSRLLELKDNDSDFDAHFDKLSQMGNFVSDDDIDNEVY